MVVPLTYDRLFSGVLCPQRMASPDGGDEMYGVKTVGWFAA
jgi:hypothetical protein